jgi:nicotinate phosphoribosyltransferase
MNTEQRLARLLMGGDPSILKSDGYKFAMAQSGFPLRRETFHLTLRKGGPFYVPVDLAAVIRAFIPTTIEAREDAFLNAHGYHLTPGMTAALTQPLDIWTFPKGTYVLSGEPVATITGPSFLVSWLEPLVLRLHWILQLATALKQDADEAARLKGSTLELKPKGFATTCSDEREIIRLIADVIGVDPGLLSEDDAIYWDGVDENANAAVVAVDQGTKYVGARHASRLFEVGMRSATCEQQHLIALTACKAQGITLTSNVYATFKMSMTPVGTTGHEHPQRWGTDTAALWAMHDMRPGRPSSLFDTFEPLSIGIPATAAFWRLTPDEDHAARFDSGDQDAQLRMFVEAERTGNFKPPAYLFEDSYTAERIIRNEAFCLGLGVDLARVSYGLGGYLISKPSPLGFDRDSVSAAYKLAMTGGRPTRKYSGSKGKESIPGNPVVLRWMARGGDGARKPISIIAQRGESVLGYKEPTAGEAPFVERAPTKTAYSPETQRLIDECDRGRGIMISNAGVR